MAISARKLKILNLLKQNGSVRVTELSTLLNVTEETVRRDLDTLGKEEKLRRTHGGALPLLDAEALTPHLQRENAHVAEKMEIAELALKQIQPHDTIVLDGSTSVSYLTRIMPDTPLTVVTNSIKVAFELSSRENINIISVGGILLRKSFSFHGSVTERVLGEYHVNKAFISCTGLHSERGFSDSNEAHASIKKRMIEIADKVYFLLDNSKLGLKDLVQISPIQHNICLITDSKAEPIQLQSFNESGVQIIHG